MSARETDLTPADVIRDAVDYVDRRGWTQGVMTRMNGSACAVGSVIKACQEDGVRFMTVDALRTLTWGFFVRTGMSPIVFNDEPDRVWDEVRKEMLAIADAWDRGEFR